MSDPFKPSPWPLASLPTMTDTANLAMFTLDCSDVPALTGFYRDLLGLTVIAEGEGYAMLGKDGATPIGIGAVPDYQPPAWPDSGRKQFHFDIAATDPAATVQRAVELGAVRPDEQPGETWTVLLDPAGHPFCVTDAANWG